MRTRPQQAAAAMVACLCIILHAATTRVSGLRVLSPAINQLNATSFNYSTLIASHAASLEVSDLLRPSTLTSFTHALAAYAPSYSDGVVPTGSVIVLDSTIYPGLDDQFLCTAPPAKLSVGTEYLRSAARTLGLASLTDDRWESLNTNVSLSGAILVASRGSCSFALKSYYAQQAGAAALIVTNPWPPAEVTSDYLLTMNADSSLNPYLRSLGVLGDDDDFEFAIPSVFVTRATFNQLYATFVDNLLDQVEFYHRMMTQVWEENHKDDADASSTAAAADVISELSSSDAASRRLLVYPRELAFNSSTHASSTGGAKSTVVAPAFTFTSVSATIDQESAASTSGSDAIDYNTFRLAAYFLLVLPTIWFVLAMVYIGRKCGVRYREQHRREQRNKMIPTVKYHLVTPAEQRAQKKTGKVAAWFAARANKHSSAAATNTTESKESVEMQTIAVRPAHVAHDDSHSSVEPEMLHITPAASPSSPRASEAASASGLYLSSAAALVLDMADDDAATPSPPPPSASPVSAGSDSPLGVGLDDHGKSHSIIGSSCAVCLSDYEEGEALSVLPCRHAFHPSCIRPWLEKSDECAVCRTGVMNALEGENGLRQSRILNWCFPIASNQREAAERRQRDADRARQQQQQQQQQASQQVTPAHVVVEAHQPHLDDAGGVLASPAPALSSEAAARSGNHEGDGGFDLGNVHFHYSDIGSNCEAAPEPLPPVAMPNASEDRLYARAMRAAVAELLLLLDRACDAHPTAVEQSLPLLERLSTEYAALATTAAPAALIDEQALALLSQLQPTLALVAQQFVGRDRPEFVESALACASLAQFAQEAVQRQQRGRDDTATNST